MMAVFNNLVMFDQHIPQNRLDTIVPDLAVEWAWNEDGTTLTFKLRQGVKWHDGKPFTASDVKCTWDLLQGKGTEKLRINPRKSWYQNLAEVTIDRVMFGPIMDLRALMGVGPRVTKHTITDVWMSPFPSYEDMEIKD